MAQSNWLLRLAVCGVIALTTQLVGPRTVLAEEESALVGHWRKTTIEYIGPRDEHLVLLADGNAGNWRVTASSRSEVTMGAWEVDGRMLNISLGERTFSFPFTMYQGQLVFPNIEGRRGFWERME